jgi:hypothetical protein
MNRYVVVSGLPASGKSTVAAAVGAELRLPVLDKDEFLAALFRSRGIGDVAWRTQLSRDADFSFRREAEKSQGAILVSWWRHPRSDMSSGTPTEWLASLRGVIVELHCRCAPAIAAARFMNRQRDPGHLDARWSHDELLVAFEKQAALGPLGLARLVEFDTETSGSLSGVAAELRGIFERARSTQREA